MRTQASGYREREKESLERCYRRACRYLFSHLPAKLVGCESSASFSFALLTLLPWVSCWALVFFLDTHLEIFIFTVGYYAYECLEFCNVLSELGIVI